MAASHPLCWRDLSASLPASLPQPQPHPITGPPHLDRFHVRPAPTFLPLPVLQKEARERVHLRVPPRAITVRCCGGHGLLPLDSGQAGCFGLLRLGLLSSELGTSLHHSPRGKGCKEHLASPSPLALHSWRCRLPAAWANAWERAVLTSSVLQVSFPKGGARQVSPALLRKAAGETHGRKAFELTWRQFIEKPDKESGRPTHS